MKINIEDFEIDSLLHSLICFEKCNSITYCTKSICLFKPFKHSKNMRNVGGCWNKSLIEIKFHSAFSNMIQHIPIGQPNSFNMLNFIGSHMLGPYNRTFIQRGKELQSFKKQKIRGIIMQTITHHLKISARNNMKVLQSVKYTIQELVDQLIGLCKRLSLTTYQKKFVCV